MKLTLLLPPRPDASWTLAAQAGVRFAVTKVTPELVGGADPAAVETLAVVQHDFAEHGIALLGLEGDPFDMTPIKLGRPGRDEVFDRYRRMLTSMGELGLHLLCYNFMARPPGQAHDWSRTQLARPLRGGALTSEFDAAKVAETHRTLEHVELWENYERFVTAVLPAAERAGVRMALHPDDPPIPSVAGMPRLFHRVEGFERAYRSCPSLVNAVTFCQANFALMSGSLQEHARRLADRVAFVHWRDVAGRRDCFYETFHDDGPTDMVAMVRLYRDLGFTGPIRMDHAPLMHGEEKPWMPGYGIHGRLLAASYLRGICAAEGIDLE